MEVIMAGLQAEESFAHVKEAAEELIYSTILPALEDQGVHLTNSGCISFAREGEQCYAGVKQACSIASCISCTREEEQLAIETDRVALPHFRPYERTEQDRVLFDVEVIQKAYTKIGELFESSQRFAMDSYHLRGIVEEKMDRYISNGETMIAMLARGHDMFCRKDIGGEMQVNAVFKVRESEVSEDTEPQDAPCQYQLQ